MARATKDKTWFLPSCPQGKQDKEEMVAGLALIDAKCNESPQKVTVMHPSDGQALILELEMIWAPLIDGSMSS